MSDASTESEPARQLDPPSRSDFATVDLELPINGIVAADCHQLTTPFTTASRERGEAEDCAGERVYAFLGSICSFHFVPDKPIPFGPMMTFGDKRTAIPDDFRGDATEALMDVASDIKQVALRARASDVCWINLRIRSAADLAISSYLELVSLLVQRTYTTVGSGDEFNFMKAVGLLNRALRVGTEAKKRNEALSPQFRQSYDYLLSARNDIPANPLWSGNLVKLGFRFGLIDAEIAREQVTTLLDDLPAEVDPHHRRHLLSLLISFQGNERGAETLRLRKEAAEELVRLAEATGSSGMVSSHWLMEAIDEFRRIPGTKERLDELTLRLRSAQEASLSEMGRVSHETDITDLVEDALSRVEGASLGICLGVLAAFVRPQPTSKLQEEATKNAADYPLSSFFASSHLDAEGKVIAYTPAREATGDGDNEWLRSSISRNDGVYRHLCVSGSLEPARFSVQARFGPTEVDIWEIVRRSPFVPSESETTYVRGIQALLTEDFITSVHILIPQLENSLRHVLQQHGFVTSTIRSSKTQEDDNLSSLLTRNGTNLRLIFGDDTIDELHRVFDDEFGPGVRHSVAHGKATSFACNSPDYVYACWIIYRLVCVPLFETWVEVDAAVSVNRPKINTSRVS